METTTLTRERFDELADTWQTETMYSSSFTEITRHPAHRAIVASGAAALPFIFARLRKQPDWWHMALVSITGANPIKPEHRGRLHEMTADWLEWADANGYAA